MFVRLTLLICSLATVSFGQNLDQLSVVVVYLHRTEHHVVVKNSKQETLDETSYGTGFLVTPDGTSMYLVTAGHVASIMTPIFRATINGENDNPIDLSSEELVGSKEAKWIFHDVEDVAVIGLHPADKSLSIMKGRFLTTKALAEDQTAPSRERELTALGFPLEMGTEGRFSPISRQSKPASGMVTIRRPDTHKPAVFFLLDSPSIEGFSGAPLFLVPAPYATNGGLVFPESGKPTLCVGLVNGTLPDNTGGKMAVVTGGWPTLHFQPKSFPLRVPHSSGSRPIGRLELGWGS